MKVFNTMKKSFISIFLNIDSIFLKFEITRKNFAMIMHIKFGKIRLGSSFFVKCEQMSRQMDEPEDD